MWAGTAKINLIKDKRNPEISWSNKNEETGNVEEDMRRGGDGAVGTVPGGFLVYLFTIYSCFLVAESAQVLIGPDNRVRK